MVQQLPVFVAPPEDWSSQHSYQMITAAYNPISGGYDTLFLVSVDTHTCVACTDKHKQKVKTKLCFKYEITFLGTFAIFWA